MEAPEIKRMNKALRVISFLLLAIGYCGAPLLARLYFIYGGKRLWLSTWTQSIGCPLSLIPLAVSYFIRRRNQGPDTRLTLMCFQVFVAAIFLGLLSGGGGYMAAIGSAHLPVSTSTIILSSQLAFITFFAFFIVRHKFSSYTINAVVLLTVGAVLLGLRANSDRPQGESNRLYILGFIMTLMSTACVGLVYTLTEWVYKKTKQEVTFTLVMEMQFVIAFIATVVATVGMLINKDFQAIPVEAREFQLGEAKYYVVLIFSAILWQCFQLGVFGALFSTSALVTGITTAVLVPVTAVLGVIAYNEKFNSEKGVALVLSLWGFSSHLYGEFKQGKERRDQAAKLEVTPAKENSAP